MIRASDLQSVQRVQVTIPVLREETRTTITWSATLPADATMQIAGDVSLISRGLTVEEHTVRVLEHLRIERDLPV
jgi:hypothetical protein